MNSSSEASIAAAPPGNPFEVDWPVESHATIGRGLFYGLIAGGTRMVRIRRSQTVWQAEPNRGRQTFNEWSPDSPYEQIDTNVIASVVGLKREKRPYNA